MDKRMYQSKKLIAEYEYLPKHKDSMYSEAAYRLKDGKIIIEFNGAKLSVYGITIGFNKYIARKGIFSIDESDYEMWKRICRKQEDGIFIDWEEIQQEQFELDYENLLKCVGTEELPF